MYECYVWLKTGLSSGRINTYSDEGDGRNTGSELLRLSRGFHSFFYLRTGSDPLTKTYLHICPKRTKDKVKQNSQCTYNVTLNQICHLLALLEAHRILHVSRIRVKSDLPSAGIIRSSPYSPRQQDKG